jgi:predicted ester cyclase
MKKIALVALVLSTTSGCYTGCNRKKEAEAIEPPPAAPAQPEAVAPKALASDEIAKHFAQCWDAWNHAAWDVLKTCYTADAVLESPGTGEPPTKGPDAIVAGTKELKSGFPDMTAQQQLVLVHGHDLAAITLLSGTHTGPFAGITAMNQKVGFLMGSLLAVDDQGRATKEAGYFDQATMLGQLVPSAEHPVRPATDKLAAPAEVVVAKDDATEQANLAVAKQALDAFNKHDEKASAALLADDLVWSEQEESKDWTKAELLADDKTAWKAFSDLKLTPSAMWAAGPYVVTVATLEGTNDGTMPGIKTPTKKPLALPRLTIEKIDGGKIKSAWGFAQALAFTQQLGLSPPPATAGSASAPK